MEPQRHEAHKEAQRNLSAENAVSKVIVDCAFQVHTKIGSGLLENAYQECLTKEFLKREVFFEAEKHLPVFYDGDELNTKYRIDFLVENKVIVELKSVEKLTPVHEAQTLTYLKLSGLKMALLINFSSPLIKDGIKRFVL